jgi:hypothetical protein
VTQTGPNPRIVRQLTLSLLVPIVSYAFPIWQPPSQALWNNLDSALAMPLRRALGLPSSAHRLSLFTDFGVLGFQRLHQLRAVAFANRVFRGPYDHPAQELFFARQLAYLKKLPIHAKSRIPFSVCLARAETDLGVRHQRVTRSDLHKAAHSAQDRELVGATAASLFKRVQSRVKPASYLLSDPRPTAVLRARFRLNRANLNAWLYRCGAVPAPRCPKCNHPSEDLDHVILHCPAYNAPRLACQAELLRLGAPSSLPVLLGSMDDVPQNHRRSCLAATATFVSNISASRF